MTSTTDAVTLASRVRRNDDILVQDVGGEVVLLNLDSETYFSLDPIGTRIWTLLGERHELPAIIDTLCTEYDSDQERIRDDLLALVRELADAGLVLVA